MDDNNEVGWKDYELHMNLFKNYLILCLNINLFYYGITGAILSFYFNNSHNNSLIIFSLALPFIIGLGLICLFFNTKKRIESSTPYIFSLAKSIGITFVHIDPKMLVQIFKGVIMIMIITQIGIFSLFINSI